jgi:phage terminase large subunit-like protein
LSDQCEFPNCAAKELAEAVKKIAEKISDYKVIESDIRYIRDIVDKLDERHGKDVNELFQRVREIERDKANIKDMLERSQANKHDIHDLQKLHKFDSDNFDIALAKKADKADIFAAIAATGVIVGVIVSLLQVITK